MLYPSVDSTINEKGYLLVPFRIRKALGLKPGQTVKLTIKDKKVELEPQLTLEEVFSMIKPAKKQITRAEMKKEKTLAAELIAANAISEGL